MRSYESYLVTVLPPAVLRAVVRRQRIERAVRGAPIRLAAFGTLVWCALRLL